MQKPVTTPLLSFAWPTIIFLLGERLRQGPVQTRRACVPFAGVPFAAAAQPKTNPEASSPPALTTSPRLPLFWLGGPRRPEIRLCFRRV
mgnify:CR=1 FL=1